MGLCLRYIEAVSDKRPQRVGAGLALLSLLLELFSIRFHLGQQLRRQAKGNVFLIHRGGAPGVCCCTTQHTQGAQIWPLRSKALLLFAALETGEPSRLASVPFGWIRLAFRYRHKPGDLLPPPRAGMTHLVTAASLGSRRVALPASALRGCGSPLVAGLFPFTVTR